MAQDSWPSPNHNSRAVSDVEYDDLVPPYVADGVLGVPTDTALVYGDSSGRVAQIRANRFALLRGRIWSSGGSVTSETLSANSSGSTRFDLVVLRYTRSTGDVRTTHITGAPGGSVPPPVNDASYFDISLASVKVINGATTIGATDVTPLAYFVAPQKVVCTLATRPPHALGREIVQLDDGVLTIWISDGSAWNQIHQDSGWLTTAAINTASGWTNPGGGFGVKIRAVDGIAYLCVEVERTGALVAANVDTTIATIADGYRPAVQLPIVAWQNAAACVVNVQPGGALILNSHPAVATGALVTLSLASWPIG